MTEWFNNTVLPKRTNRPLLAYVPEFNQTGYEVVTWNGNKFESELHGVDIHEYVQQWSLIYEAD